MYIRCESTVKHHVQSTHGVSQQSNIMYAGASQQSNIMYIRCESKSNTMYIRCESTVKHHVTTVLVNSQTSCADTERQLMSA